MIRVVGTMPVMSLYCKRRYMVNLVSQKHPSQFTLPLGVFGYLWDDSQVGHTQFDHVRDAMKIEELKGDERALVAALQAQHRERVTAYGNALRRIGAAPML